MNMYLLGMSNLLLVPVGGGSGGGVHLSHIISVGEKAMTFIALLT